MFDWLETTRPPVDPKKREAMIRRDLEDRAALLYRLRFDKEAAKARLRANLAWEFERNSPTPLVDEVDGIVERTWKRASSEPTF